MEVILGALRLKLHRPPDMHYGCFKVSLRPGLNALGDSISRTESGNSLDPNEPVGEMKEILGSRTFLESKTFLQSFIRRVEYAKTEVGIEYTVPVNLGWGVNRYERSS